MNEQTNAGGGQPERIRVDDEQDLRDWATRLDASPQQIRDAVQAVGDDASEVEVYLKGTRSTVHSDQVRDAGAA